MPGQQVSDKHQLGRLQYSLDYDFQTGQVGVKEAECFRGRQIQVLQSSLPSGRLPGGKAETRVLMLCLTPTAPGGHLAS